MICPGTNVDCDNVGCRRGGCQGRLPELPLFQAVHAMQPQIPAAPAPLVLLHAPAEQPDNQRPGNPKLLAA
jgi:hypothetical protein